MQVVLVMFRADGERRSFSVVRDMTVIGRREDCDLRIPLGEISRKHCRLIKDGDAVKIEDLGSSNGTFHNGTRVQEAVLSPGDRISVGPVGFVVQIDGVPNDDELTPAPTARPADLEDVPELTPVDGSVTSEAASDLTPPDVPVASAAPGGETAEADDAEFDFSLDEAEPQPAEATVDFELEEAHELEELPELDDAPVEETPHPKKR